MDDFLESRILIRNGNLYKIPRAISVFDEGKEFFVQITPLPESLEMLAKEVSQVHNRHLQDRGKQPIGMSGHRMWRQKAVCPNSNLNSKLVSYDLPRDHPSSVKGTSGEIIDVATSANRQSNPIRCNRQELEGMKGLFNLMCKGKWRTLLKKMQGLLGI